MEKNKNCCEKCFKWGKKYGEEVQPCDHPNCPCHQESHPETAKGADASFILASNFLQMGRTIECGHCNPKYRDGLDRVIKALPNYVCDCDCHNPAPEITKNNWEENYPIPKDFKHKPKAEGEKCPDPYCGKDEWFCPTHFHEEPQSECPLKQYGIFHESGKCDCYKPPKDTEEGKCPNCGAVEQNWIKKCPACGAEGCYQCIDIHACVPTPTRGGWEEDVYAILPILDTNLTTDSKMAAIKKIVGDLIARERKEIKFRGYVIRGSKEILK